MSNIEGKSIGGELWELNIRWAFGVRILVFNFAFLGDD